MADFNNPGRNHAKQADNLRNSGEFSEAGEYYTLASHAAVADSEFTKMTSIAIGIYWLLSAVLSYRLAGSAHRAKNRAEQGVLLAQDLRAGPFQGKALRGLDDEKEALTGLTHEYAGDFQLLVDDPSFRDSYECAVEQYDRCDLHHAWCGEAEFEVPFRFFADLTELLGQSADTELLNEALTSSLTARITFKGSHSADAIQEVCDRGEWPADS